MMKISIKETKTIFTSQTKNSYKKSSEHKRRESIKEQWEISLTIMFKGMLKRYLQAASSDKLGQRRALLNSISHRIQELWTPSSTTTCLKRISHEPCSQLRWMGIRKWIVLSNIRNKLNLTAEETFLIDMRMKVNLQRDRQITRLRTTCSQLIRGHGLLQPREDNNRFHVLGILKNLQLWKRRRLPSKTE